MKLSKWLENWGMTSLRIKTPFLDLEWNPQELDKKAAWDLYVELLTRVTTQALKIDEGNEKSALNSIHTLFPTTRQILKEYGRDCVEFSKIAIVILNQIIRPFTSKWHKIASENAFNDDKIKEQFRKELQELQVFLNNYARMLSDMAGVEDLTDIGD